MVIYRKYSGLGILLIISRLELWAELAGQQGQRPLVDKLFSVIFFTFGYTISGDIFLYLQS